MLYSVQKPVWFHGNGLELWSGGNITGLRWSTCGCARSAALFYRHGPLTSHPPWHSGHWNGRSSSRAKLSELWLPLSRHTNYRVDIVLTNSPWGWEEETEAELCMNRKRQRGHEKMMILKKILAYTHCLSLSGCLILTRLIKTFDCTVYNLHCVKNLCLRWTIGESARHISYFWLSFIKRSSFS